MTFTFHYASTLSVWWLYNQRGFSLFTFHYASTLSAYQGALRSGKKVFTFHYASTLSEKSARLNTEWIIYIPLCFYFIIFPMKFIVAREKFTFHYASTLSYPETESQFPILFTFHYASTLSQSPRKIFIPDYFDLHSTMLLLYPYTVKVGDCLYDIFTFHYASTLSGRVLAVNRVCEIYIPLCFYFIAYQVVYTQR